MSATEQPQIFQTDLTTHILSGPWTVAAITQRCREAIKLKTRHPWARPLAKQLIQVFPEPPGSQEIQRLLGQNPKLQKWLTKQWETKARLPRVSSIKLPPMMLPAVAKFRQWKLPEITTPAQLAAWLQLTPEELDWLADPFSWEMRRKKQACRNYRYRWLRRPGKSARLLESPKQRLRELQGKILREILDRVLPHPSAHGFRKGHSIATFVTPHVQRELVCRIDLRNFFAQIRRPRVSALFRTLGYPKDVAAILAALCTNAVPSAVLQEAECMMNPERLAELRQVLASPHLPQGAPTSPALANLVAYRLDCRLQGLLQVSGGNYTRYADDLVFSGDRQFARGWPRLKTTILAIVMDEGFRIRARKSKEMFRSQQQQVGGLVINQSLHLPREEYDALKACLFNCQRFGPSTQNHQQHPNFREHLAGRVSYLKQFQPHRAGKLQRMIDGIDWSK